jgi:hypothetical protein
MLLINGLLTNTNGGSKVVNPKGEDGSRCRIHRFERPEESNKLHNQDGAFTADDLLIWECVAVIG